MTENWERRQYTAMINKASGEGVVMDNFAKRLGYLRATTFAWADVLEVYEKIHPGLHVVMVTLTYRKVGDYKPGHINDFMRQVKYRCKDLLSYCWVAEMQKRGAVHYHVMLVGPDVRLPKPDKSGMWPHGMTRIEKVKTLYYICKYTGKEHQKDYSKFPRGCRTYAWYFADKSLRSDFKLLRDGRLGIEPKNAPSDWAYVASTVTQGYAEFLLGSEQRIRGFS